MTDGPAAAVSLMMLFFFFFLFLCLLVLRVGVLVSQQSSFLFVIFCMDKEVNSSSKPVCWLSVVGWVRHTPGGERARPELTDGA